MYAARSAGIMAQRQREWGRDITKKVQEEPAQNALKPRTNSKPKVSIITYMTDPAAALSTADSARDKRSSVSDLDSSSDDILVELNAADDIQELKAELVTVKAELKSLKDRLAVLESAFNASKRVLYTPYNDEIAYAGETSCSVFQNGILNLELEMLGYRALPIVIYTFGHDNKVKIKDFEACDLVMNFTDAQGSAGSTPGRFELRDNLYTITLKDWNPGSLVLPITLKCQAAFSV